MSSFMDTFLKRELSLREEEDLQIQRAHRSLGPKPQDKHAARSILVNFQRFDMKDKVLRAAGAKKIIFDGKVITFANDMPTEINNKMKEYKDIKKSLKEAKIRFQTPYPAKQSPLGGRSSVYKTAKEAAEDARKRGLSVEIPCSSHTDWEQQNFFSFVSPVTMRRPLQYSSIWTSPGLRGENTSIGDPEESTALTRRTRYLLRGLPFAVRRGSLAGGLWITAC
uniref:Uncharacterized protein n=1 Tax=Knipowitschia caucasica TaxID=637954 RepID=A0AAV2KLS7_KNICA